eukprot:IDg23686t1
MLGKDLRKVLHLDRLLLQFERLGCCSWGNGSDDVRALMSTTNARLAFGPFRERESIFRRTAAFEGVSITAARTTTSTDSLIKFDLILEIADLESALTDEKREEGLIVGKNDKQFFGLNTEKSATRFYVVSAYYISWRFW